MTQPVPINIQLLNKSYTIKCPPAEMDNLHLAVAKLNDHLLKKRMQFKQLDEFNILLLAALQVSHELIMERQQQSEEKDQLAQLLNLLERKVNRGSTSL